MEENGWDLGPDEEELFEFAMHEKQYREYKSGEAKRRFNQELEEKMKAKFSQGGVLLFLSHCFQKLIFHHQVLATLIV